MNNKTQYFKYTRDPRFIALRLNFIFVIEVNTVDNLLRRSVWPTMGLFRHMEREDITYMWIANPLTYQITVAIRAESYATLFRLDEVVNHMNITIFSSFFLIDVGHLHTTMDLIMELDRPNRQVKWRVSRNIFYLLRS